MRSLLLAGVVVLLGMTSAHAHDDRVIKHRDGTVTVVHTVEVSTKGVRKPSACVKRRGKVIRCTRTGYVCKKVKTKKRGRTTYVWQCRKKPAKKAPVTPPKGTPPAVPVTPGTPGGPVVPAPGAPSSPSTPPVTPAPPSVPAPPASTTPVTPPVTPPVTTPTPPEPVGSNADGACSAARANDFTFTAAYKPAWKRPLPWYYNPASQPAVARSGDVRGLFTDVLDGWTYRTACGVDPHVQSVRGTRQLLATSFAGDSADVGARDNALVVRYADNATAVCGSVSAVGCTFTRFFTNGTMISADLVMRSDVAMQETGVSWSTTNTPSPWQLDFQATLMHEVGHALGLKHATTGGGQIMSPVIQAGPAGLASRSPGAGDLAGRDGLYP